MNHFAVHLKLTQHCKLPYFNEKKKALEGRVKKLGLDSRWLFHF